MPQGNALMDPKAAALKKLMGGKPTTNPSLPVGNEMEGSQEQYGNEIQVDSKEYTDLQGKAVGDTVQLPMRIKDVQGTMVILETALSQPQEGQPQPQM